MKQNVGGIDRGLRIAVGLALIGYAVIAEAWWGYLGIIPLLTGIFSFCPAYSIFGASTKKCTDSCCASTAKGK